MKKTLTILTLVALLFAIIPGRALAEGKGTGLKKRIAVVDFEDKTGHGSWHIGSGMADMLTTALVKSGNYMVIERQQLELAMKEQSLGLTGAVTPQSAAQVGKILGVELMVLGSVNEFGEKSSSVGGGLGGKFGLNKLGVSNKTARVGLDIRLVNTSTTEIVAAEGIAEEESKKGLDVSTSEFDFSQDSHFDETLAGKATRKTVNKAIELISKAMEKLPWNGKILKVNADKTVMIKPGAEGGVKVGDQFNVFSQGQDIIDPDTGLSLGSEEKQTGSIKIIDAKDKFATAKVVTGSGFKAGDMVREQTR